MKKYFKFDYLSIFMFVYDIIMFNFSYFFALLLRFDFVYSNIHLYILERFKLFQPIYSLICIAVFVCLKMYDSIWIFTSFEELHKITISSIITGALYVLVSVLLGLRLPISLYVVGFAFQFLSVSFVRIVPRIANLAKQRNTRNLEKKNRVMVIGAGEAGRIIVRELTTSHKGEKDLVCIIDDDKTKWGKTIDGIKIVGGRESINKCIQELNIEEILLTIPSMSKEQREEISKICKDTGCIFRSLPSMYRILEENNSYI